MKKRQNKQLMCFLFTFLLLFIPFTQTYAAALPIADPNFTKEVTSYSIEESKNEEKLSLSDYAKKKASALISAGNITSLQYALIQDGNIILSDHAGVYSKSENKALTDSTMYGIGSVSKIFTTTAVLQLVEEGKIDLDTPVVTYIEDFKMADERYKQITVRMLLNHSSGLMGSTLSNTLLFNDKDHSAYENLLKSLETQRLKADPGAFSVYCNDGFSLAELLVERVTDLSFTQYIEEKISKPLNLMNTKTPLESFPSSQLAKIYQGQEKVELPIDYLNAYGAGGIYSTATDLCYFSTIFHRNPKTVLLSSASIQAMENKEYLNGFWPKEGTSMLAYGLGWDNVETYPFFDYQIKALSKGGDTHYYHGELIVLPEENMSIAILSSGGSSSYHSIFGQSILLKALQENGKITEIISSPKAEAPVKQKVPKKIQNYAGYYGFYGGVVKVKIKKNGTLLFSSLGSLGTQSYIYNGNGRFYDQSGTLYISFKEENGNTYLFAGGNLNLPSLGNIVMGEYQAQKLLDNPLSPDIEKVWKNRNGKKYYLVSEKYSSQVYISSLANPIYIFNELPGYFNSAKIIDENTAKMELEIPGNYGRDLTDSYFYTENGVEYLKQGNYIFMSEQGIQKLPNKNNFIITIKQNGYASCYKIPNKLADKKIVVDIPEESAFIVYDAKGKPTSSYLSHFNTATLPKGGMIVFVGKANSSFSVTYK